MNVCLLYKNHEIGHFHCVDACFVLSVSATVCCTKLDVCCILYTFWVYIYWVFARFWMFGGTMELNIQKKYDTKNYFSEKKSNLIMKNSKESLTSTVQPECMINDVRPPAMMSHDSVCPGQEVSIDSRDDHRGWPLIWPDRIKVISINLIGDKICLEWGAQFGGSQCHHVRYRLCHHICVIKVLLKSLSVVHVRGWARTWGD